MTLCIKSGKQKPIVCDTNKPIMETTNFSLLPGAVLRGATATYKIVRTLGQGTFGITYLAETTDNASGVQSYVAVKEFFMKAKNSRNGSTVNTGCADNVFDYYKKKFEEEALHIKALKHPNIVKCSETFCANNTVYFVMEYIEGESLAARVARLGRLSEQEALRFTRQIGSALTAMHRNNMLHLDVKPSNIMLRGNEAVLIDFGLSKQYDDNGDAMTQSLISSGTNGYAPMEQFHYHEHDGLPVTLDVHALGATLFFVLTGYEKMRYLPATIDEEGFPRHILETNNVTKRTIDVVEKAMAHHKKNRYQTVEEMLMALDNKNNALVHTTEEETLICSSTKSNVCEDPNATGITEIEMLPMPQIGDDMYLRYHENETEYSFRFKFGEEVTSIWGTASRPHANLWTHIKCEMLWFKDPDWAEGHSVAYTDELLDYIRNSGILNAELWDCHKYPESDYYKGNYGIQMQQYRDENGEKLINPRFDDMRIDAAATFLPILMKQEDLNDCFTELKEKMKAQEY